MRVSRVFTQAGKDPYAGIAFEKRTSELRNTDGSIVFRMEGVEVPSGWSQIATDILAQKYFRKAGVPREGASAPAGKRAGQGKDKTGGETSARQVFHRLAHTWRFWGEKHGYFATSEDAQAFYDEIVYMLANQMAAPNSPQWFNTGLHSVYGISGPPQGHFYADPVTGEVKPSENAYERPQPHACQPYAAPVSTPRGPVPIGEIVEKDLVGLEVYDGTDQGRGTTSVVAVKANGVKPVLRVVLKNGAWIDATPDHLVWARDERRAGGSWRRMDELRPGMRLDLATATGVETVGETPEMLAADEAFLAGWIQGDGFAGRRASAASDVVLTTTSRDLAGGVQTLLLNHGIYSRVSEEQDKRENRHALHQVSVGYAEARERFRASVGFVSEDKVAKLDRSCSGEFAGKRLPALREEAIVGIEPLGPMPVFDIQTASAQYLSNNVVVHNCFIQSIEDDLVNEGGIMDLIAREARIFKYGSGTGSNFSRLRGRREPLSGGGISSGVLSFLRVNDRSASSIKSGGTTRRAAKMVILDADHPDIGDYIDWKVTEEHKVASMVTGSRILRRHAERLVEAVRVAGGEHDPMLRRAIADALRDEVPPVYVHRIISLARQGVTELPTGVYSTEWDDEAYNTVSGQSSNNSVRVTNEFMQAVLDDTDWELVWRTDATHKDKVRARALWEKIAVSAWQCADPGLQYHTTMNEWHTCPVDGEIRGTNPCVTGDTLVATEAGLRRIDSLVGAAAVIVNGDGDPVTVNQIFKTGTRPVFELKTASGYRVRLTADHPVKTVERGDVRAIDLTIDDHVILEKSGFGTTSLPEEAAILLGASIGDGCVTRGRTEDSLFVTVGRDEPHVALQLQDCVNATKAWVFDGDRRGTRPTGLVATATSLRVGTAVASVVDQLSRYAVLDEGSDAKRFTDEVHSLDRETIAAILRGLFTTDGTVVISTASYVGLDSTSLELLCQVQMLLLGFGIKAKIYENRRAAGRNITMMPDGKGGSKPYYVQQMHSLRISRTSRVTFEREIGFLPSSPKAAKLAELNASIGVYEDRLVDRVASLEPRGIENVYDLTEPESHHFVANGIVVHNCSEYAFLDDTACNLASLNLLKYYDPQDGRFKLEEYRHAIRLWTIVLEISVLMAQFPSREVARRSYAYRTLGLGYANLGTLLMVMGVPYDSGEGRAIGAALSAILSGDAYAASAEMAGELGAFQRFDANRAAMLRVIRNHRRAAHNAPAEEYEGLTVRPVGLDPAACPPELVGCAQDSWDNALALGEKNGYRNAQVTAIAPTGTIGLVMDCDTTGIEPDYALVKFKKLAGGGYLKIINQSIPPALRRLGYTEQQIREIVTYAVGHGSLESSPGVSLAALVERGLSREALDKVEALLPSSFSLGMALTPTVIGAQEIARVLGRPAESIDASLNVADALGFTREQVEEADRYACGAMTIEGAPHLSRAHYAVFDTANRSGRWGTRFIQWKAHVDMMAAAQPYISGAISKTINMPAHATVEEIKEAYLYSWRRMLKAIALYRDGSKLSQPLSSLAGSDAVTDEILAASHAVEEPQPAAAAAAVASLVPGQPFVERRKKLRHPLPNRRNGYTQKAKIGQHSLFIRTGEYDSGQLGEIFLDMHKEGAAFRSLLNSFAIAVSLGLQYGVPLEEYVDAFTFTRFEPNGMVHGHDNIRMCTSVLDLIFRDLALTYLQRIDLVQVKPEHLIATETMENGRNGNGASNGRAAHTVEEESPVLLARMQGYEGDPCPTCGHFTLVRNGTCLKCETCGGTTGCS